MTSHGGPSAAGRTAAGDAVSTAPDARPAGTGDQVASAVKDTETVTGQPAINADRKTTTRERAVAVGPQQPYDAGPIWALVLPPLLALGFAMWHITTPSYWRDEAATMAAVKRPFGDMIRMLGNVDAVHGAYYIVMWPIAHLLGTSELVMRLPSALAVAVTAAFVAAIGRRMVSPWVGLTGGLLYAIMPVTSRFGQEARSYAIVMATATVASYLLIRIFGAEGPRRRRWLVLYAASLALLGIMNIFGLLLVPAHTVVVALQLRRRSSRKDARRLAVAWLVAVVAGVAISSPVLVLGWLQRGQIAWLANAPAAAWPGDMSALATVTGATLVTVVLAAVILVALAISSDSARARRAAWRWTLAELALPWMLVPPVLLIATSVISPIYTSRYVLMCIPAAALLGGMATVALGRVVGPVALVLVLVAGAASQLDVRMAGGHSDNIRRLDIIVNRDAKPGDYVLYTNPNADSFSYAYSYGLGSLPNIAMKQAAIPSGTLAGTSVDLATIRQRLAHAKRVWVVEINNCISEPLMLSLSAAPEGPAIEGLPLHFVAIWRRQNDWLFEYKHGEGNKRSTTACLVRP